MILYLDDGRYVQITILKNEKGTFEYYNDGILIGVYQPTAMKDSKFLAVDLEKNDTIENELSAENKDSIRQIINEIKEKIDEIELEQIEEEAKENELIKKYIEENEEFENEEIKAIRTVELEKEIEPEKEKKEDKKEKDEQEDEETKQVTTSDINVKQEVDLDERATDVETFRHWLGGNIPKDAKKIAVIESAESYKMKDEDGKAIDTPSTRYSLAIVRGNKQIEPLKKYIPQLEQNRSAGNNPRDDQYQIDTNGQVEKDPVISEYRIGNKIIQLDKDHGDDLEVNIGKYGPFTNNLVTTRMRDRNTQFATDTETRKAAMGHYKGVYETENSYQEAKEHEEAGCEPEKLTSREIDGEQDTGHTHYSQEEIDVYVKEIMKNEKISEIFTEREVRQRLENNLGEIIEEKDSIDEIKKQTEQELEEDASHFRTRE